MQTPSASDPSFKTFLEDLQKQNNQSFVTQIFQLRAEREIAGKDGDKREEQLHDINETLISLYKNIQSKHNELYTTLKQIIDELDQKYSVLKTQLIDESKHIESVESEGVKVK